MKNKLRKKDLMKGLKKGLCLGLAGVMLATGSPVAFGESAVVEAREITRADITALMSDISTGYSNARAEFSKFSYKDILKLNSSNEAMTCRNSLIEAYDLFLPKLEEHYKSIAEKTTLSSSYIDSKIQTWSTKYSSIKDKLSVDLKESLSSAISKYKDKDKTKYNDLVALNNSRKDLLANLESANNEYVSGLQNAKTRAEIIEREGNTVTQSPVQTQNPVQTQAPTQAPVQTQAPAYKQVNVHIAVKTNANISIKSFTLVRKFNGETLKANITDFTSCNIMADVDSTVELTDVVLSTGDKLGTISKQVGQRDITFEIDVTKYDSASSVVVNCVQLKSRKEFAAIVDYVEGGEKKQTKLDNLGQYFIRADKDTNIRVWNIVVDNKKLDKELTFKSADGYCAEIDDLGSQPTAEPVQTPAPVVTQPPVQTPAPKECIVNINVIQGADKSVKIQSAEVDYTKNGCTFAKYLKDSLGCSVYAEDGTVVEIYDIVLTNGTKLDKKVFRVNGDTNYDIDISAFATLAPTVAPTQALVQTVAPTVVPTQAPVVITEPPVSNGPIFTEKPVYTQAPVYTQQPTYTQTPVNTYNPGNTTPVYTQAPVVTDNGNSVPGTIYTPNPVNPTFAPVNPGTVAPATSANPGTGAIAPGNGSTDGNVGPNSTQKPDVNPGNGNSSTVPGTVKTPTPQQTEEPDGEDMEVDNNKDIPDATVAELTCTKKDFKVGVGERFKLPVKGVGVTFKGDAHCSVDRYGYVKAKKIGNGKVVVTDGANTITVNVDVKKAPTKVKMKAKAFKVKVGKEAMIRPKFTSTCWSSKNKWKSSNKKIFTVENGKIKGIKKGTAKLTVITYNGKKATAKIIVYK